MSGRLPRGLDPITVTVVGATGLLFLIAPLIFSDFFVSVILTKALWLGIAAASLIFLSSYAGMVSLGQVGLYAVAGFTMANLVAADGGLDVAWSPWVAVIAGIAVAGLVGPAASARSHRAARASTS